MEMKKHSICLVLLAVILLLPITALALEVDFPSVAGQGPTDSFGPAQWISYIFVFSLAVVGLAMIYALTRAGLLWMTAGDNSGRITEAKEWIRGAVIGLIILVGSVTFLRLINPQLVTLKNPQIKIIGTMNYWKALFTRGNSTKFCTYFFKCRAGKGKCVTEEGETVNDPGEVGICDSGVEIITFTCNNSVPDKTCFVGERCLAADGSLLMDVSRSNGFCSTLKAVGEACNNHIDCAITTCELDGTVKKCSRNIRTGESGAGGDF